MSRELRVVARWARIKVRCAARRMLGGALYGASLAWWCCYGATYTAFGIAFAAMALVVSTAVAVVAVLFSGE